MCQKISSLSSTRQRECKLEVRVNHTGIFLLQTRSSQRIVIPRLQKVTIDPRVTENSLSAFLLSVLCVSAVNHFDRKILTRESKSSRESLLSGHPKRIQKLLDIAVLGACGGRPGDKLVATTLDEIRPSRHQTRGECNQNLFPGVSAQINFGFLDNLSIRPLRNALADRPQKTLAKFVCMLLINFGERIKSGFVLNDEHVNLRLSQVRHLLRADFLLRHAWHHDGETAIFR